jgi:hypothetical protein
MTQVKITIYGPKGDGTYIVEFKTAAGETLAISVPSGETAVLQHFQARMPYGLVVPAADRPPDDGWLCVRLVGPGGTDADLRGVNGRGVRW